MIVGTTPDVVNERLKAVNGFSDGKNRGKGNLVVWEDIPKAFPGIQIRRVWYYDNNDVKKNVPNVLVEVPGKAIGGSGKHWVVFIGNQKCYDPWTGLERPTNDFVKYGDPTGYCVLTGRWNTGDDVLLNLVKTIIDTPGTPADKISKIRIVLKQ